MTSFIPEIINLYPKHSSFSKRKGTAIYIRMKCTYWMITTALIFCSAQVHSSTQWNKGCALFESTNIPSLCFNRVYHRWFFEGTYIFPRLNQIQLWLCSRVPQLFLEILIYPRHYPRHNPFAKPCFKCFYIVSYKNKTTNDIWGMHLSIFPWDGSTDIQPQNIKS